MLCLQCNHRNDLTAWRCRHCGAPFIGNPQRQQALALVRQAARDQVRGAYDKAIEQLEAARDLEPRLLLATENIERYTYGVILDELARGSSRRRPDTIPPLPPQTNVIDLHRAWLDQNPDVVRPLPVTWSEAILREITTRIVHVGEWGHHTGRYLLIWAGLSILAAYIWELIAPEAFNPGMILIRALFLAIPVLIVLSIASDALNALKDTR